jgi:hypothetical protein
VEKLEKMDFPTAYKHFTLSGNKRSAPMKRNGFTGILMIVLTFGAAISVSMPGHAASPHAPADITITDTVVAADVDPIGANLTTIADGTNFAVNNHVWNSGFEPMVVRKFIRIDRAGTNWFEWDSFGDDDSTDSSDDSNDNTNTDESTGGGSAAEGFFTQWTSDHQSRSYDHVTKEIHPAQCYAGGRMAGDPGSVRRTGEAGGATPLRKSVAGGTQHDEKTATLDRKRE